MAPANTPPMPSAAAAAAAQPAQAIPASPPQPHTVSDTEAKPDPYKAQREALVPQLGKFVHHILAHSGVLPKLEGKQENHTRRQAITNEIQQLVNSRPAKDTLNSLIARYGDRLETKVSLAHDCYETFGSHQTVTMFKHAGLDIGELRHNAKTGKPDLEHILAHLDGLLVTGPPTVMGNLVNNSVQQQQASPQR